MDIYVVRIYRRDARNPDKAAGQVEIIEHERIVSFTCVEELLTVLDLKEKEPPGNAEGPKRTLSAKKTIKHSRKNS